MFTKTNNIDDYVVVFCTPNFKYAPLLRNTSQGPCIRIWMDLASCWVGSPHVNFCYLHYFDGTNHNAFA